MHTIVQPHRHGSNLRHAIPKTQSSRLHNLPRYKKIYMYIYIWANRWSDMAPKPMSTVGSAGNSIYYPQYAFCAKTVASSHNMYF